MKLIHLAVLLTLPMCAHASFVEFSTTKMDYKEVSDATIVGLRTKVEDISPLEAVYITYDHKEWPLKDARLKSSGDTVNIVGYYYLGKSDEWFMSTQFQTANSNLFPKSTIYHESNYRFLDKQNLLMGLGLGYQTYYNDDSDTFFKIGPVLYFSGGAAGYKYGKYSSSDTWQHILFATYDVTPTISMNVDAVYGEGAWDVQNLNQNLYSNVETMSGELKLSYDITRDVSISGTYGKKTIKNKVSKKTEFTSDIFGIGLALNF